MCLGIPGRVVEVDDAENLMGVVDVSGVRRRVTLACVVGEDGPEGCVGEWVLVHVGFAMSRIDEAEAAVREAETVNASQPPSSDTRLRLRLTVARIRHARGDLEQALEDSQALLADLGAIDHREVGEVAAQVHLHVALVHADRQELEAASSAAAQAVALRTALHGEDHYLTQEATKLLRKYQDGEPQGG